MYILRGIHAGRGKKSITEAEFKQLTTDQKKWYYKEVDEDDDYVYSSNRNPDPIIEDEDDADELVNVLIGAAMNTAIDDLLTDNGADISYTDDSSFDGFGGGSAGGGGSSDDY